MNLNDIVSFLEKDGDYSLEGDALDACRHDMGLFIVKARQKWDKAGRHRSRFRTQNQEWLKVPAMNKPLTPTVSSCRSLAEDSGGCGTGTSRDRSMLSFSEKSVRCKRRDTSSLVQLSADKLLHAAKRRLRAEGQNDLSFVIKQAAATPTRPAKVRRLLRRPPNQPVMYTPEEALRLFVDGNFTKNSWQLIRSSVRDQHANIYPSYHEIHAAKVQCCPDGIHVEPEAPVVPLQDLLDHTARRLVQLQEEVIRLAADVQHQRLQLISKWGLDGSSGHSSYKEGGVQDQRQYFSLIVTSVVPLRLILNKCIVWQNPAPSSTRFCRPLKLEYAMETSERCREEVQHWKTQIQALSETDISLPSLHLAVEHKLLLTMLDGKAVNAITDTSSQQRCSLCGATQS